MLAHLAAAGPAHAQTRPARFQAAFFAGTAWSLPTRLVIRQRGEPDIRLRARYATRPWRDAPYYAYRLGYAANGRDALEAELVHHKLYLTNLPPEVRQFEVTHGYNLATLNYARRTNDWSLRVGVGLTVAHAENVVRGRRNDPGRTFLGGGYHIAGPTMQLAAGYGVGLARRLSLLPEVKLTASTARVPVADGSATVPNVALHALLGLGAGL
ncbi:MAG TPA: hypothetical protein VKA84_20965 [Gemmatimonadaceae bacterium]|nr:hypothetical protein [Gemmatimonadaceae bacterium]